MVVKGALTGNRQTNYGGPAIPDIVTCTEQYSAPCSQGGGYRFWGASVFKVDRRKPRWKLVGLRRMCGRKSNWLSSAN